MQTCISFNGVHADAIGLGKSFSMPPPQKENLTQWKYSCLVYGMHPDKTDKYQTILAGYIQRRNH